LVVDEVIGNRAPCFVRMASVSDNRSETMNIFYIIGVVVVVVVVASYLGLHL
jgi:heme/copper-type cytochrome/quinol oxidase subunit 4